MSALGEMFRTARESQGLTLSDVADRIHIRSVYLAAIEAEDWQAIGPAVYVRGFIRSYARSLGLDADAAVARFGSSATPVVLASPRGEPSRSGLPRGDGRRTGLSAWAVAAAVVAVALVAFAGYRFFEYQHDGGPANVLSAESSAPATQAVNHHGPSPAVPSRPRGARGVRPSSTNSAASGFAVHLRDDSWLRVVVDGKVTMEGVFRAGTSRSFAGRTFVVRTGNAGGVDLTVDGKNLGTMGGLGDVAERSFQL